MKTVTCTITVPEESIEKLIDGMLGTVVEFIERAQNNLTEEFDPEDRINYLKDAENNLQEAWAFLKESLGILHGFREQLENPEEKLEEEGEKDASGTN